MERELKNNEVEETLDIFQDPAITAEEERKIIRDFRKKREKWIKEDPEYRALLKELGLL
ncbi:hypothetical protein GTO87_06025 [Ligilactobacillus saerimneri]|uniref:Uncharacterized protein n=1 Tax=Ligilactobacillus saerimneri TaxID=228229 RepID=A0A7H9EKE9_9LACO|nr:hypothetical protein [Ligilactobacillus saerimneri]QLL78198.1 hypothetical protein GTO87_06025 [Ligilactobacillus saerimneri]